MSTRNAHESPLADPSEVPTRPRLRLPHPALPPSLPAVPWIERRAPGDGGATAPSGARPNASDLAAWEV